MAIKIPKRNRITVFIQVYNEADRLEACLKSFSWAEKLIVFVKSSSDQTREIAKKYATEVVDVPYSLASENTITNINSRLDTEWFFFITASSLIHPKLASHIVEKTMCEGFSFDVIGLPYAMYSLGIHSKFSPYGQKHKRALIRRKVLKLSDKIHEEIGYEGKNIYDIPWRGQDVVFYHLTHGSVIGQLERTLRYIKYEINLNGKLQPKHGFRSFLNSLFIVLFRRRSFLLGWDGVALGFSILIYHMLRFLLIWESKRSEEIKFSYDTIRSKVAKEFDA